MCFLVQIYSVILSLMNFYMDAPSKRKVTVYIKFEKTTPTQIWQNFWTFWWNFFTFDVQNKTKKLLNKPDKKKNNQTLKQNLSALSNLHYGSSFKVRVNPLLTGDLVPGNVRYKFKIKWSVFARLSTCPC